MKPLPPEVVAGIDQHVGAYEEGLNNLIARYKAIAAAHGSAAATAAIAAEVASVQARDIGNMVEIAYMQAQHITIIVDTLACAIARLADR